MTISPTLARGGLATTDRDRVRLSFRERGMTLKKLAGLIGEKQHTHLSEVLNNKAGHGHHTRPKLFPHLTPDEIRLLGWTTEYNAWLRSTQNNVPTPVNQS